jgi:uncharacterized protein (UPF0335 family)
MCQLDPPVQDEPCQTQETNMADVVRVNTIKPIAERVIRLMEQRKEITEMIAEEFAAAKNEGFDVPLLKKAIADSQKDQQELSDKEEQLALYRDAIVG